MVEPVTTALAGIALVTKSVEFIKSNIKTAQDMIDATDNPVKQKRAKKILQLLT